MAPGILEPPTRRPNPRRVSSFRATLQDFGGPTIIFPGEDENETGDSHEVASSLELARQEIDRPGAANAYSIDHVPTTITDQYAFAFDIDGVLIRGGEPIPEAITALQMLNGQNSRGIKVPYIFVTNGGGKSEQERCIQLSKQLKIEVSPGQFICGHTPMREMASKYSTVLVVGGEGEKCREVAKGYGFKDVVTPGDIIKTRPDTVPFRTLTKQEWDNSYVRDFSKMNIEAIFVFADSRDWASDQQIIIDVLTSKDGVLGTKSVNCDEGPPLFFAHNDVVWATSHASVRLGMGALRKSIEAMYEAVTGKELKSTAFGKPQIGTFEFATRLLKQWRKDTHGIDAPPNTVYFVGDTPESDIRGTNEYNDSSENHWYSILVNTGVHQKGSTPRHTPVAHVENVLEAVKHGMERELKIDLKKNVLNGNKAVECAVTDAPGKVEVNGTSDAANGVH